MATELQHEVGLAGRYATAVYELASENNSVDALENDLLALRAMMNESADLTRLVRAPVFSQEVQAKALKALLARMAAAKITTQFVLLLTSKRRLFILADVIRAFERIVARARGEIQAQVVSARALSTSETADLKAALKSKLGREPRLETKVDPSLLGGLVVKVGSRMIDSSLRTKLLGLRAAMRGN